MLNEPKTPSKRLFVGSLPYKFTEGELLSLFVSEGKIVSVKIIHNQWGKSRGMGYVEFESEADAIKAKNKFHNFHIADRTIIVDYAQPDPFLTPEGQARHQQAVDLKKNKRPQRSFDYNTERSFERHQNQSSSSFDQNTGDIGFKPRRRFGVNRNSQNKQFGSEKKFGGNKHIRQSVFESRNFGSKIGSKFANRNKKRK